MTPSDPNTQQTFSGFPPPAPAQRAGSAPPTDDGPRRAGPQRRLGELAIGAAAGLALVLSLVAAFTSWRVTSSVDKLQTTVDSLRGAPVQTSTPGAPTEATEPPTDTATEPNATPTGSTPSLNAQTQFTVNYTKKRMRISGACNDSVYIDLDEPRVQSPSDAAELSFLNPCGGDTPPRFTIQKDDVQGSEIKSDSVTPAECNNQIQLSPLPRAGLPIRQCQVYCIMTSLNNARASAQSWKMVVLSVTSVASDDTVALEASAWDIPY